MDPHTLRRCFFFLLNLLFKSDFLRPILFIKGATPLLQLYAEIGLGAEKISDLAKKEEEEQI